MSSDKKRLLAKLFFSTFTLSAFTFGGGYVIITLMKKKFVDEYHWIEEEEMLDFVAIAQSAPGPIAVNGAIIMGYKIAGISGLLFSVLGTILPPFIILSAISACYGAFRSNEIIAMALTGMQAGVGAVIASVVFDMGKGVVKERDVFSDCILIGAFAATCFFQISVVAVILACGLFGLMRTLYEERKKKGGRP